MSPDRIGTRGTKPFVVALTLAAGLALAVVSGGAAQADTAGAAADSEPYPPEAIVKFMERLRAEFGLLTTDRVRSALGPPDSVHTRIIQNRYYTSDQDAAISMYYPGVEVGIYYVSRSGKEILRDLWITGVDRTRGLSVGIGDSAEALVDSLGPPVFIRGDVYRYWFGEATNRLDFRMVEGRIAEIHLDYYSG